MVQSLLPSNVGQVSLFRKKRTIISVIVTGLITLFLFYRHTSQPSMASWASGQFDELHGLLYMVSNTGHVLPHDIDPSVPIPPSGYFPRESYNRFVWKDRVDRLRKEVPLIVFSKSYCPYSRGAKELLAQYDLQPAAHIVEVDLRGDSDIIKRLLIRLTSRSTFPNIVLQGKTLGGYDNLRALHGTGELERELEKAGLKISGDIHEH